MNTRKSMTFPIVIAFIIIAIIVYLFATIKQSEISCSKTKTFDGNIRLTERLLVVTDGKEINSMRLTKTIVLPEKYLKDNDDEAISYAYEDYPHFKKQILEGRTTLMKLLQTED